MAFRSHTYFSDVLDIVNKAKDCDADCLVTLGAGSLTDAAKVVSLLWPTTLPVGTNLRP